MRVEVSHPEKAMFPADGITKGELVDYYVRVAETMLPHVRGRPVSMQRFPGGVEGYGFFHKDIGDSYPSWVKRVKVTKRGGSLVHAVVANLDTLPYLANQNCVTPHVWLSRADRIRQPDRMVFDLDPSVDDFAAVRRAARRLGALLRDELDLEPHAMVTGSRGLHVWVALRRGPSFPDARDLAARIGTLLAARYPDELSMEFYKDKRDEKIFIDVNRNAYAQTAVPPYAVRPRPGAPVATPVRWEELSDSKLRPDKWTVRSLFRRLGSGGDPWEGMGKGAPGIAAASKQADRLLRELG